MKLSQREVQEFFREGYFVIPNQIIAESELNLLRWRYDSLYMERRDQTIRGAANPSDLYLKTREIAQKIHDLSLVESQRVLQIMEMWRLDEAFERLVRHEMLLDIVESLIGPEVYLFHDQALYKPAYDGGEVPWHQDNVYWRCTPPKIVSIWLALDDANEENGCMNVAPGSHLMTPKVPAENVVSVPRRSGFAMVHHCLTMHRTNANRSDRERRAFVIHYMPPGTHNSNGDLLTGYPLLRSG